MSEKNKQKEFGQLTRDGYNKTFSKFLQNEEQKKDNIIGISAIIMSILLVFTGTIAAFYYFSGKSAKELLDFYNKNDVLKLEKQKFGDSIIFNKRQNILVLGVDSNGMDSDPFENTRSDTIVVLSINPKSQSVNILSIPRDSKVYLAHGKGIDKINAAHALGGIELVKDTIESTFGFKIHNYIVFNTEGVVKFVDAIGGIPVYVEKDMRYHDYSGRLNVNLTKGEHILNGKEAEGFLRFRKDALGDIGRTSRQQWFLRALAQRLKDPDVRTKIPEALKVADKYVKSDLSLFQMSQYAAFATGLDMSKIETATLPGAPNKKGYISYWILDPDKCREVINRMIYNKTPNIDADQLPIAGIMYTPENTDKAMALKRELEEAGYNVNCERRRKLPHPQIFGHAPIVTKSFVNKLKKNFDELNELQFVYDPIRLYSVNSDFTVILSQ